jgi:hypothetical protein
VQFYNNHGVLLLRARAGIFRTFASEKVTSGQWLTPERAGLLIVANLLDTSRGEWLPLPEERQFIARLLETYLNPMTNREKMQDVINKALK